jgi:hypothetical protein
MASIRSAIVSHTSTRSRSLRCPMSIDRPSSHARLTSSLILCCHRPSLSSPSLQRFLETARVFEPRRPEFHAPHTIRIPENAEPALVCMLQTLRPMCRLTTAQEAEIHRA